MLEILPPTDDYDITRLHALMVTTYRAAYAEDMGARELEHHIATVLSPTQVSAMVAKDRFWLAVDEREYVAYLQLGFAPDDLPVSVQPAVQPGDLAIRRVYVQARYQRRGLGSRLMQIAIAAAQAEASRLFIDVWETNHGARRLYEGFGFTWVGEQPGFDLQGQRTGADQILRLEFDRPDGGP